MPNKKGQKTESSFQTWKLSVTSCLVVGVDYLMWFVLILGDKWLLLLLSIPNVKRNPAVPAAVLLGKGGCFCSWSLLPPFYRELTSCHVLRRGAAGPWADLVSSSLPQGHLSSLHPSHPFHSSPFYPQLLSPLAFASLLKPGFFLLCGVSGLQGAWAGEWWLLDHRTFLHSPKP